MQEIRWIGVDWGTSNLRAWMMGDDDTVLDRRSAEKGMNALDPDQFENALLDLVSDALPENGRVPVLCCGMVGARQGWAEAPYRPVPCKAPGTEDAVTVSTQDPRLDVRIIPGVKQENPPDVMRGEETQIGGFLSENKRFDGIVCLPGTHTKWAHISAEEIVSFRTYMTGEMFDLLSRQSVLRHSVQTEGWDEDAFVSAVDDAMASPKDIGSWLFGLRAGSLLAGLPPERARARLSGLLIGLELAGARSYWLGMDVALIGTSRLVELYELALVRQGLAPRKVDGDAAVLAGLRAGFSPDR